VQASGAGPATGLMTIGALPVLVTRFGVANPGGCRCWSTPVWCPSAAPPWRCAPSTPIIPRRWSSRWRRALGFGASASVSPGLFLAAMGVPASRLGRAFAPVLLRAEAAALPLTTWLWL